MSILKQIIADKFKEVELKKKQVAYSDLEAKFKRKENKRSFRQALLGGQSSGIIAEIKRRSPSKGILNDNIAVDKVAAAYSSAGVSGISVLTDNKYFSGSNQDLLIARQAAEVPILRKEFIIDEYQILEAGVIGADMILLIARILSPERAEQLAKFASSLGLEVLLEVHNKEELEDNLNQNVDIVGVNNRDLDTLKIDINLSLRLAEVIPDNFIKISESGLSEAETLIDLMKAGYKGFLMGENFMKQPDPGEACKDFITRLNLLK